MRRNNTVIRVARILKCFSIESPELGVSEIATQLGLAKSVVHGDLAMLFEEKILEKNDKADKYYIGSELVRLGQAAAKFVTLRQIAFPVMERLAKVTQETIALAGWINSIPHCIERINSTQPLNFSVDVGGWYPLHAGGVGKVLVAFLPEGEREKLIKETKLVQYTKNTITNASKLRERLKEIRKDGYAVSVGEMLKEISSAVAPIFDNYGRAVAVISIGGPTVRFKKKIVSQYSSLVVEAAKEISLKLGFRDFKNPE